MATVIPQPPQNVPFIDPVTGQIHVLWQNYLLALASFTGSLPPIDAQYWVSTANSALTNERNIGALATGYLKITTTLAIATPSTVTSIPPGDVAVTWTNVAYASGNFTGNAAMTWSVGAGDQTTYAHASVGKLVTITIVITDSSVGGTPNTTLQVALPAGMTAVVAQGWPFWFSDDGISGIGRCTVAAGGTVLQFQKANGTAWNATTNATDIEFTGALQVA